MRILRRGFTLIEVLLYLFVVGSLLAGAAVVTRLTVESRARIQGRLLVEESMAFALARVSGYVEQASGVTFPEVGQTSSTMILSMSDVTLNPITVTLQDGLIMMQRGAQLPLPLISPELVVTSLSFTRLDGTPPQIRMAATARLRSAATAYRATSTFGETVSIRR